MFHQKSYGQTAVLTWTALFIWVSSAQGQEWGNIRGRILYDGTAPQPTELDVERDAEFCGQHGLVDESLVVSPTSQGIRYVAIWLDSKKAVPIHPETAGATAETPVLDNQNCRFEPHMLAVQTGQKLTLKNSDPVAHNAAVYVRRTTPFSELIPQNQPLIKVFTKPETQPTRVDCSIHAWMKAWLIITEHPYVAITDEDGNFELRNLPAGEWNLHFWHERSGDLKALAQMGSSVPLKKGVWTLTVPASETLDLGDLMASEDQFAGKKR